MHRDLLSKIGMVFLTGFNTNYQRYPVPIGKNFIMRYVSSPPMTTKPLPIYGIDTACIEKKPHTNNMKANFSGGKNESPY